MAVPTLHACTNIHASVDITCDYEHSCIALHYMNGTTFMLWVTLHGTPYIHVLCDITWGW